MKNSYIYKGGPMLGIVVCSVLFACLGSVPILQAEEYMPFPNQNAVEDAILSEKWDRVGQLVETIAPDSQPPVPRFLKGHAYLALNRNNESLCTFLSLSGQEDAAAWQAWTKRFAAKHTDTAVAHYLKGDASARAERWAEALVEFNLALGLNPRNALVLNARGGTFAAKGQWDQALLDFVEAVKVNPSFADAYASRAALYIQRNTGAAGAVKWFNKALEISPQFALALNGRGSGYAAQGKWEQAEVDFQKVRESTPCVPIVMDNLLSLNQIKLKFAAEEAELLLAQHNPGTEIFRKLNEAKMETTSLQSRFTSIDQARNELVQLRQGDTRARQIWKPMWEGIESIGTSMMVAGASSKNPVLTFGGGAISQTAKAAKGNIDRQLEWNKPYINQLEQFDRARANSNRTINKIQDFSRMHQNQQGGVTTDMRRTYMDQGNWPFVTWVGLAYYIKPASIR